MDSEKSAYLVIIGWFLFLLGCNPNFAFIPTLLAGLIGFYGARCSQSSLDVANFVKMQLFFKQLCCCCLLAAVIFVLGIQFDDNSTILFLSFMTASTIALGTIFYAVARSIVGMLNYIYR